MIENEVIREKLVAKLKSLVEADANRGETESVLHRLKVHQLELELQNRELREAQAALEESRSRYVELYDFAPIPYFTFDVHGCVLEVNLTGAKLIGRDRAHLIGLPFISLVELADPAPFWAHLRRCTNSRGHLATELELISPHPRYVRAVTSPVAGPSGHTIAFRTALIDITDRRRAELARVAALASETTLRRKLEQIDQAKTVLARSLATATEPCLRTILQVIVDEVRNIADAEYAALGVGPLDLMSWVQSGIDPSPPAECATPWIAGVLAALNRDAPATRVADIASHPAFAEQPTRPAITGFLGLPIRFGDRVLGSLCLTNTRRAGEFSPDDQHAVEALSLYVGPMMEAARLRAEAEDAIRSRDNLLAVVSHDLRSPLSAISIGAHLLQTPQVDVRRQAETIARAAARMTRFTNDLLTATALDAGVLPITLRPERLDTILREAAEELVATCEHNCQLEVVNAANGLEVVCDRDRVYQVLANLVGNARKFMTSGGRITIEAARCGDNVQISVTDAGPGIPAAAIPRIFDRYWKGRHADQRGVGLGLYICKGIVTDHGGRIWVESSSRRGTRFSFTLPIAGASLRNFRTPEQPTL